MNNLLRFYNQNRHMVWIIILSIIAIIVVIQIFNKFAYEQNKIKENINLEDKISTINKNYSVITGQEVKANIAEIIDEFINYCNSGQIKNAYEMLSDECKEVLYPNLNDFTEKYYNRIFDERKTPICQAWITQNNTYTYRIDFVTDMLATGKPSSTSIVDYYTVVDEKININKFVGIENINSTASSEKVTIKVQRKRIYMDYEIYDIQVINNTQNTIMLDDMKSTKKVYIEDSEGQKYFWYNHEILESDITIKKGFSQETSIKFNKEYRANNEIVNMVFDNVILNEYYSMKIKIEM